MFKNILKHIKFTNLIAQQITFMSAREASSATGNYGDYIKFLELVGNCKVSIDE
jgi:hypothetical protein